MDFYFGFIGEHKLASETQIVIVDHETDEIISVNSLEDAEKRITDNRLLFIWSPQTGKWEHVDYIALSNKPAKTLGFKISN